MRLNKIEEGIIKGSEINTIEMYATIRITMLELLKGYPAHLYFGIFEGRFERGIGEKVVIILNEHNLIEFQDIRINNEIKRAYHLTPKGIEVAVSLAQLKYAEKMDTFTKVIIILGTLTSLLGINQLILTYLQHPIF